MYVVLADPWAYTTHHKHAARIMKTIEEVYDDYLYDCHIANKRLTPEEWQYYGREEHHIEIPSRDGGVLTPLNSQHLTTYQHWVAGVLQSEVLQKCCFAYVPKNRLPKDLEKLRIKWRVATGSENGKKGSREGKRVGGQKARDSGQLDQARSKRDPNKLIQNSINNLNKANEYWKNLDPRELSERRALARGARPFILVTPWGEKLRYLVISQAQRDHNIGNLSAVLKKTYSHTKGFTAYYVD
jgi:hypothetical protein